MQLLFETKIPGRPIVKKNTKRIFGHGKKKTVIYSPKFQQWEKEAYAILSRNRPEHLILNYLYAEFTFYFKNHQGEADTSNLVEGIQDVLKKAGIIEDDRLILKFVAEKRFASKEEQRTEVKLFKFDSEWA